MENIKKLRLQDLNRLSIEAFHRVNKMPLIYILDNIRSMHNIGAAFRIADAFLIEKIYLCGITATPPHREIHKTALGAEHSVAWTYVQDILEVIPQLKEAGYDVVAIEQTDQSISLEQYRPIKKQALVFGNEVFGVQESVLQQCKAAVEIPQYGTKHSLNVAVSMGIVTWEIIKWLK